MKARSRSGAGGSWLLALLCLALGSWVSWVLAEGGGPSEPAGQPRLTVESLHLSPVSRDIGPPPLEELTETVERPIFVASRRPAEAAAAIEEMPAEATADVPVSLRGVMIGSARRKALLQMQRVGQPVWAAEGASVGGWQVETILPDSVTLRRGGVASQLRLEDEPAPMRPKRKKRQAKKQPSREQQAGKDGQATPALKQVPVQNEETPAAQATQ